MQRNLMQFAHLPSLHQNISKYKTICINFPYGYLDMVSMHQNGAEMLGLIVCKMCWLFWVSCGKDNIFE